MAIAAGEGVDEYEKTVGDLGGLPFWRNFYSLMMK
jgi:hypothetical protein